jgi:glucose-1-phosphate cytidylyltransferase
MKVVLFCGGLGTRLGELTENVPKPLVKIGYRPILWHLMKYYAHYGHKEFILCLGYRGDKIKEYFINYNEYLSNDFTMKDGGRDLRLENSDISDWSITFVDTGLGSNIGQRLKAVEKHLDGEEAFLANYADGLTNLPLPRLIEFFRTSGKTAVCLCVKPPHSFHVVKMGDGSAVESIEHVRETDTLINGGFYVFKREIFDYIKPGEELVVEPFKRLIAEKRLLGFRYDQFWCMDTFKEHQELTDMYNSGSAPWQVWKAAPGADAPERG